MPLSTGAQQGIGAGIAAAGSVLANALSNVGKKKRQKYAWKKSVKAWKAQNAYNHPVQQMARLQEAGLNPNLIYGTSPSSAVGSASGAPEMKPVDFDVSNVFSDITKFADLRLRNAQADNTENAIEVQNAEVALKGAQTANEVQKGRTSKVQADIAEETKNMSIDAVRENLRNIQVRNDIADIEKEVKGRSKEDQILKIANDAKLAGSMASGQELRNTALNLSNQLNELGVSWNDPLHYRVVAQLYNGDMQKMWKDLKGMFKFGNSFINSLFFEKF